ncbi:MAG: histone deacetylase family protein [Chitinispirillaceae bacterium]|nr:histone deacetylase family protein [Chitinispirillaceae bacterium]
MFRIRCVSGTTLPIDRTAIEQVQQILREQFPGLRPAEVTSLQEKLSNPLKFRYRSILFVAENGRGTVQGFALLSYEQHLRFCFLDYLSSSSKLTSRGIGGALYERIRDEASFLKVNGLYYECLPDDPNLCRDPEVLRQNEKRLRFYERYGARPITGTAWETPFEPGDDCPPYLVFDPLETNPPPSNSEAREIFSAILELKYGKRCPPGYVEKIFGSVTDPVLTIRPPRYQKKNTPRRLPAVQVPADHRIFYVVNDRHSIHHVHDRGYVETPVRISSILREIEHNDLFQRIEPRHFSEQHLTAVHKQEYIDYFRNVCETLAPGNSVYPYVFPIRNTARPPKELAVRAGYYCIDTFTPLNNNAFTAARHAVDCTLTAADLLLRGTRITYALVRPPGHHAEFRSFGGFCYFNNASIAANMLSREGPVALLDIDYHHGNGHQDIFYRRRDVLTISLHGHPSFAYPYFSGFREERGEGEGKGYNCNYPIPEQCDGILYRSYLTQAVQRIARFKPMFLVVSLGLDTAKGDPTGTWTLGAHDFELNGNLIGALKLPTLVAQEGGYSTRVLGINARRFLTGLRNASLPQ